MRTSMRRATRLANPTPTTPATNAGAGGSERLEHDHLADAAVARARNAACQNDGSGKDAEGGEELDDVGDLDDDGADGLERLRHVDDGDGGVCLEERALQLADPLRHGVDAA